MERDCARERANLSGELYAIFAVHLFDHGTQDALVRILPGAHVLAIKVSKILVGMYGL